jgi:hypothetical protein
MLFLAPKSYCKKSLGSQSSSLSLRLSFYADLNSKFLVVYISAFLVSRIPTLSSVLHFLPVRIGPFLVSCKYIEFKLLLSEF